MKKLFSFLSVLVVLFAISACGMTVVESPMDEVVTLEVRMVSSERDSVPIDFVEVRNDAGEVVASVRDSLNRVMEFQLPRGDYSVSARISGHKGSVYMERDIVLLGGTSTTLDITESATYYLDMTYSDSQHESYLMFYGGDSSFDHTIYLELDRVEFSAYHELSESQFNSSDLDWTLDGWRDWVLTPIEIINYGEIRTVAIDVTDIYCPESGSMTLGVFNSSWSGEGMSKQQTLRGTPLCPKG